MDNDWTKVLGFPGYRVYKHEIDEQRKHLTLWIRRKRGNRSLRCPACGRRVADIHEVFERVVRDLRCFEYTTTSALAGTDPPLLCKSDPAALSVKFIQ